MSSLCWECKYEHSDCKGDKWVEKVACQYFSKKLAINYPKIIEGLEKELEKADRRYDILLKQNEALLLRADRFEAENKELKFENNKLRQWTLNDRKVRHGFELAIETLKKCKECDTE